MLSPVIKYFAYFAMGLVAYNIVEPLIPYGKVKPYYGERVLAEVWSADGLTIHAVFTKNGACKIVNFAVVGFSEGIPKYLTYKDLDDVPENFDREEGAQGLNIKVLVDKNSIDFLELRTRHSCLEPDGSTETVTKVFSRHEAT